MKVSADRKDAHVELALAQSGFAQQRSQFDDVRFVHHALAGIDRGEVWLDAHLASWDWPTPLYINAMTGGSEMTGLINRELAIAARETGLAMAVGSMSRYFKDPDTADTFTVVRRENPDGFVMANINATASPEQALRAVDLLRADALQIHLNSMQETIMPEGDRSFGSWKANIERIAKASEVPVIVKEVGFGLSRPSIETLDTLGVSMADVSGTGGTNFARIENGRREHRDLTYLEGWGQSTPACLLEAHGCALPLLASGGIRNPLDVLRCLALGARAVGVSGGFLAAVRKGGATCLTEKIESWLDQIAALMTALGARTPADLADCDLLITGGLREYCDGRGINLTAPFTRR
ncbi:type 2 isopentenyl-diphosphate Delta-isomerase [Streptomyces sp. NPDC058486]|uniref:type 2 isopentenyl-diphosphate Delta-isomerase n=1 Tax=unclassified Streptomyces TaxID=2593676 RepID=UPI00365B3232